MTRIFNSFLLLLPGIWVAALLIPEPVNAQITDTRLPISLDADSTSYDGVNSMLVFRGLKLSQGRISIEADEARASKLDFEDSIWEFSGSVIIDIENGHIEADLASLQFVSHDLKIATIEGSPATFELQRTGSDDTTYAEAGRLEYDLDSETIEFSDDARITEGGNQISSSFLVYNITEKRVSAQSSGADDKVKITYTPVDVSDDLPDQLTDSIDKELQNSVGDDSRPATDDSSPPGETP